MPSLPNLPTDNLYKFMTALGLALVALGAMMKSKAETSLDDLDAQIAEYPLRVEQNRGDNLTAQFLQAADRYEAAIEANDVRQEADESNQTNNLANIQKLFEDVYLLAYENIEWHQRADAELASLRVKSNSIQRRLSDSKWLAFPGLALLGLGFWMWYSRHQTLQDALLRIEVARAQGHGGE